MIKIFKLLIALSLSTSCYSQSALSWKNVDTAYGNLPSSVHVFFTNTPVDTGTFRAYYVIADLKDKSISFTTDTTFKRRLTPSQFFQKNREPLVVVNCTFFSFETNQNLNVVITDGRITSYNRPTFAGRGKDTFTYRHVFPSAIGITRQRTADVAYIMTDSIKKRVYASQQTKAPLKDSVASHDPAFFTNSKHQKENNAQLLTFKKWKMQTAVGGGPVLLQDGQIHISNNEELKFAGKAINDKHPRTAMGYTNDHHLIILVIEGRNPQAGGATLAQTAQVLKDLGCVEAINLDGGGSSCMLVNGKETIHPSDKTQRPVPAVFIIKRKK